jgi:hypothetical protein
MPTDQIVSLLIAERDRIQAALDLLQGPTKKRGRPRKDTPPAWVTSNKLPVTAPAAEKPARKKRIISPAQRKRQAEKMRLYWKNKKKAAKS